MQMLGIAFPTIDPVLVQIGPLAIRWYALSYIAGLLLAWWLAQSLVGNARFWRGPPPLAKRDLDDALIWAAFGVVIGGRLGHVLIYDPVFYAAHPLEVFETWRGGMAFHGGLIGCAAALIWFSRQRNLPVLSLFDVVAVAAPIGIGLGRIANFINGELWGRVTDAPWAIVFPHAGPLPRHPSQLYEAVFEGLLLFVVLRAAVRRGALHYPGLSAGLFAVGYGVARTAAEFFREPDPALEALAGGLTMGMVLSGAMVALGAGLISRALSRAGLSRSLGRKLVKCLLMATAIGLVTACAGATSLALR